MSSSSSQQQSKYFNDSLGDFQETPLETKLKSQKLKKKDSSFTCMICQADLTSCTVDERSVHVNRCIDGQSSTSTLSIPDDSNTFILDCPLCFKHFPSPESRTSHIKKCGRSRGLSTQGVIQAIRLQERHLLERRAMGLPLPKAKQPKQKKPPAPKKFTVEPKSTMQSDLQLAKALSLSLQETQSNDVSRDCVFQLLPPSFGQKPGKQSPKKKISLDSLLLVRTEEERKQIIMDKVNDIIAPSLKESTEAATSVAEPIKVSVLWRLSGSKGGKEQYYVPQLLDWITPSDVETGSKLSNLSQIPGHYVHTQLPLDYTFNCEEDDKKENEFVSPTKNASSPSLLGSLQSLIGNSWMSDLDIHTASGIVIPAHTLLLALRCPALKHTFEAPCLEARRILKWEQTSFEAALHFLNFIYTGSTEWKEEIMEEMQHLAFQYGVQDLLNILKSNNEALEMIDTENTDIQGLTCSSMNHQMSEETDLVETTVSPIEDIEKFDEVFTKKESSHTGMCNHFSMEIKDPDPLEESDQENTENENEKFDEVFTNKKSSNTAWSKHSSTENLDSHGESDQENAVNKKEKFDEDLMKNENSNASISNHSTMKNKDRDSLVEPDQEEAADLSAEILPDIDMLSEDSQSTVELICESSNESCQILSSNPSLNPEDESRSNDTLCFPSLSPHIGSLNKKVSKVISVSSDTNCDKDVTIVKEKLNVRYRCSPENMCDYRASREFEPQNNFSAEPSSNCTHSSKNLQKFNSLSTPSDSPALFPEQQSPLKYKSFEISLNLSPLSKTVFSEKSYSDSNDMHSDSNAAFSLQDSFSNCFRVATECLKLSPKFSEQTHQNDKKKYTELQSCSFMGRLGNQSCQNEVYDVEEADLVDNKQPGNILDATIYEAQSSLMLTPRLRKQSNEARQNDRTKFKKLKSENFRNNESYQRTISNGESDFVYDVESGDIFDTTNYKAQSSSLKHHGTKEKDSSSPEILTPYLPEEDHLTSVLGNNFFLRHSFSEAESSPIVTKQYHGSNILPKTNDCISISNNKERKRKKELHKDISKITVDASLEHSRTQNILSNESPLKKANSGIKISEDIFMSPDSPWMISGSKNTEPKTSSDTPKLSPKKVSNNRNKASSSLATPNSVMYELHSDSPITPFPDYRTMPTPKIKEALKRIGVKGLPRSKAVAVLNHVYESTHPVVGGDTNNLELEKPKDNGKRRKRKAPPDGECDRESKKPSKCSQLPNLPKSSQARSSSSSDNTEGDPRTGDPIAYLDHSDEEINENSQADSEADNQKLHNFLLHNDVLYSKILHYKPIRLSELQKELKENNMRVSIKKLMDYLDEQCITFTMPRKEEHQKKQNERHQKFRKRMIAKLSQQPS